MNCSSTTTSASTSAGSTTTTTAAHGKITTTTTTGMPASITTTTVSGRACPAKNALGADNPKLENLREFRDCWLARSAPGRRLIQMYYAAAESSSAALERSPELRAAARRVLEAVAPMVGGRR